MARAAFLAERRDAGRPLRGVGRAVSVPPLGPESLVLCAGTIARSGLRERAEAAAVVGFQGLSLFLTDYERARQEGLSDADLRRILDDCGLRIAELDPLMSWFPGARLGRTANADGHAFFRFGEEDFYRVADALGARSINAVFVADEAPEPQVVEEAFAGLCDRAASHGLLVGLEFLPWTPVAHLASALAIAEAADRPNGGITLDTWHFARSGGSPELIDRAPADRILSVQISDAPAEPWPDVVEETTRRRLLPGQGDVGLVEIVRALDRIGCQAPMGIEVFSDWLAPFPVSSAARSAHDAIRGVLHEARNPG